jgi:hypothetical protein
MRRSRLATLLLAGGGCGAALLAGEVLIRATDAAPQVAHFQSGQFQLSRNERIGWEPIPNPESTGDSQEPRWSEAQRNSMGYRDYEHSLAKVPGMYRIAVLGDSVVKGFGVPDHERTYSSVLEARLRASGIRCEVMNFAVEGYNTQQEVETLEDRGLRYAPDLVILAYVLNDRSWPAHDLYRLMLEQERRTGRVSGTRLSPLLARSALYRFLRFRVFEQLGGEARRDPRIERLVAMVEGDTVELYMGVLRDLKAKHGFDVMVVVFPYLRFESGYSFRNEHSWVAAAAVKNGLNHLDLFEDFVRCAQESQAPIAQDIVHPTAVGLECAARSTAEYVERRWIAGKRPEQ